MNYELAKKLKDAGFPQRVTYSTEYTGAKAYTSDGELIEFDDGFWRNGSPIYYVPTLSELIDVCGEDFRMLLLHTQYKKKLSEPWETIPNKKRRPEIKGCKGKTPEEAVANLWLVLNKHE